MTRALAFFLAMTAAAQAGAWDEFERRCLVPMEKANNPLTSDFTLIADDEILTFYRWTHDSYVFEIGAYRTVDAYGCGMAVLNESDWGQLRDGYRKWRDQEISNGRYEVLSEALDKLSPTDDAEKVDGLSLHSTDWREPKLRLRLIGPHLTSPPYIFVEDTDLES